MYDTLSSILINYIKKKVSYHQIDFMAHLIGSNLFVKYWLTQWDYISRIRNSTCFVFSTNHKNIFYLLICIKYTRNLYNSSDLFFFFDR